jgi:hypothetical protein
MSNNAFGVVYSMLFKRFSAYDNQQSDEREFRFLVKNSCICEHIGMVYDNIVK